MSFSYDELTALPSVARTVAIECAGNGRRLFASQQGMEVRGTPWGLGAIGVARWRGVPLAEVLERAGIRDDAVDLMPAGSTIPTSPTASTTGACGARCRSARRSTTCCSPTR